MNHEATKKYLIQEGLSQGMKQSDLKVLSTDPYFVGSAKDYEDAKWIAALWDRMMASRKKQLHLRGFHYWIQSQGIAKPNGEKYAHGADPAKDWSYLLHCAQIARYLGIGEWKNLIDLKHPDPKDYDSYFVGSGLSQLGEVNIVEQLTNRLNGLASDLLSDIAAYAPKYHTDGYQVYHTEVWCEKNSMGFVIEPACRRYEACYQPLVGQSSVEKVDLCAERAIRAAEAGKKVRIFYISDFDRYGWSMVSAVARKLEFFLLQKGSEDCDLRLTRLALNQEHIDKFKLPYAPKHGEKVVELDALEAIHPGELGKVVSEALKPYFDADKPAVVREENARIRGIVNDILNEQLKPSLEKALSQIDATQIVEGVDLTSAIDPEFEAPEPGHDVEEDEVSWVLDSTRDYWTQLDEYKKYKGERQEEEA